MLKKKLSYVEEHQGLALAAVAGPALLLALKPVAERIKAHPTWLHRKGRKDLQDNVGVVVTMAEAEAILAAVGVAENGRDK